MSCDVITVNRSNILIQKGSHRKVEESNSTMHVTLLTGETNSHPKEMVAETIGKGIIDSASTKTVAGTILAGSVC